MVAHMLAIGVALGALRRRARSAGRARPDLSLLGASRVAVVTAPPDTALPLPLPAPPAAARVAAPRRSPRQQLSALGTWLRQHGLLRHEAFVAYLASVLSIAAYAWYSQHGQTLAYGDAITHMTISRRVFASHTPGLAQLGTVWPPVNHILMLPLVWNTALYRDGFAGSFPSMVAYVVAAVYLYRTAHLLFASPLGGWAAALVLMLNPNVLYMQSTPMSELDLLCFAVVAVYYATRWAQTLEAPDLVKCALATAAGTLVRYDGWALAVALLAAIAVVAWRKRGRLFAEANVWLYATLGFAGCAAWLIYEWVIFGNALDFLSGPYSDEAKQHYFQASGNLPAFHNIPLALHIYAQSVIDNASLPLCIAALAGLVWWAMHTRRMLSALPAYATLVPFGFNCLSLVLGISILETPEILTSGHAIYFNVRYGTMTLPAVALFAALLAARSRWLLSMLLALTLVFGVISTFQTQPYVLNIPLEGTAAGNGLALRQAQWLASHYRGGEILIGSGASTPMMFETGLPERDFLSDGDGALFKAALKSPQVSAAWVVISLPVTYDAVWAALHNRTDWRPYYTLATTIGTMQIYERIAPGTGTGAAPTASGLIATQAVVGVSSALRTVADNQGFTIGLTVSRALAVDLASLLATGGTP